ncbi:hypothetical protein UFOVP1298_46 [uncultured Caudovirales phage]|uniref:Uncharacterized protein n=1 Tax=uncultured Caudovirales phage TaxID=2100421 RepID=A0A6J5RU52_9CAUD|nr:hypothetical protein UFOVP1298_46 [uncultured Caudovirales phage]
MIYPFTVKNLESILDGFFDVQIERQKVLNYAEPSNQEAIFMTPAIVKFKEFYHVKAETEEAALDEVARIIAAKPESPVFELDMTKVEINVVNP